MKDQKNISEIRKKPGMSNAGKYPNVAKEDFAGEEGTYPVNTKKRYGAALSYLHHVPENKRASYRARILKIAKRKGFIANRNERLNSAS